MEIYADSFIRWSMAIANKAKIKYLRNYPVYQEISLNIYTYNKCYRKVWSPIADQKPQLIEAQWSKYEEQTDNEWSTKHYTEN
jgi:hypothetical protein